MPALVTPAPCFCPVAPQEEQIELLKEGDDMKLLVEIFMSELSRVRYLLRVYLRVRLQKVERHVMHILDSADVAARLSEREAQYARDYFVLFGSHMKAAAANHLPGAGGLARRRGKGNRAALASRPAPPSCQRCFPLPLPTEAFSSLVRQAAAHPAKDMVPAPDLDRHVFARVLEDRGNVTVDEEGCAARGEGGRLATRTGSGSSYWPLQTSGASTRAARCPAPSVAVVAR
jgi:hypothetical protein